MSLARHMVKNARDHFTAHIVNNLEDGSILQGVKNSTERSNA